MIARRPSKVRGRKLLDKHGLHDWRFSVESLQNNLYTQIEPKGFWGLCDFANKTIRINYRVGRRFRQVVLHEIAHALLGRGGHDEAWMNKAYEVGCSFNEIGAANGVFAALDRSGIA